MLQSAQLLLGALLLSMVGLPAAAAPAPTDAIAAAISSPLRSPRDVARDPSQMPAEVLAFAGVKPGDRVADFWPTPPYSTALLSGVVGPKGRVYALIPPKLFKDVPQAEAPVRGELAPFANVTVLVQPFDRFVAPELLDLIWLGKIYHDFPNATEMGPLDIAALNNAVYAALKPGGTLMVIDHAAAPQSGFRDTAAEDDKRTHRIDPAIVKADLLAAGFEFVGASEILANPADDHRASAFDPAIRNKTDRFILKFRKPPAAK